MDFGSIFQRLLKEHLKMENFTDVPYGLVLNLCFLYQDLGIRTL